MNPTPSPYVRSADLSITDPVLKKELLDAVDRVLSHGMMLLGPEVEDFERKFADVCSMPYAVGVASGTSAVYMALKALGVGPGDEIITTPMSWIATLNALRRTGATPVFVDIGDDLNLDAQLIEAALTPRTKAILPVHFCGLLCDMPSIVQTAKRFGLLVVEDASQAFGAALGGDVAGGFGDAGAFSLNPMKILHGYGEAGAVTLRDEAVRDKVESLRYLGTVNKELCTDIEMNHKIDAIQAALLAVSLDHYQGWLARRRRNAARYTARLGNIVECPAVDAEEATRHVYFTYTIRCDRRDELKDFLISKGVEAAIKHPILMPDQPAHSDLPKPHLPRARTAVGRILTLPVHEKLTDDQIDFVCERIGEFYDRKIG